PRGPSGDPLALFRGDDRAEILAGDAGPGYVLLGFEIEAAHITNRNAEKRDGAWIEPIHVNGRELALVHPVELRVDRDIVVMDWGGASREYEVALPLHVCRACIPEP